MLILQTHIADVFCFAREGQISAGRRCLDLLQSWLHRERQYLHPRVVLISECYFRVLRRHCEVRTWKCCRCGRDANCYCSRCHRAFYCCVYCQRLDWPQHRSLCHTNATPLVGTHPVNYISTPLGRAESYILISRCYRAVARALKRHGDGVNEQAMRQLIPDLPRFFHALHHATHSSS